MHTIDGAYDITAKTPLGLQRGRAIIDTDGNQVTARIDMGSLGSDVMRGTCAGTRFRASGSRRQFPFGRVAYEIEGSVDAAGKLSARLTSRVATIDISGERR